MEDRAPEYVDTPPLHEAVLTESLLLELFDDIAACTDIREVLVKRGPKAKVCDNEVLSLTDARDALLSGSVPAVQLRYVYEGSDWWDTIMAVPGKGYRLVRVQHNF
jgi:hypothetical protein